MSKHTTIVQMLLVLSIVAAAFIVVMGNGRDARAQSLQDRFVADRLLLPRVQLFNLDDTVARLDTVTGEVHIFTGDVRRAGSRGQWRLLASGVSGTSGFLEVVRPSGVEAFPMIFLVDVVTGDTWAFNRRPFTRAMWEPVEVFDR